MNILGVDFSGAAPDKNTWAAWGSLQGDTLFVQECRPLSRRETSNELETLGSNGVAALDFPFSVPVAFANYWAPGATSMPRLWDAAAVMDLSQFTGLRDEFVAVHGEPKREIDLAHPESFSCLHKVNPNMLPMTFRGMQMLARLWPLGFDVPPLPPRNLGKPVLLEVMPGAVLRSFGLPFKGYKGGKRMMERRETIVEQLPSRSPVAVNASEAVWNLCLQNHDCLDSVVAALAAALWATRPGLFRQPTPWHQSAESTGLSPEVAIEGWLYAPTLIGEQI